MGHLSQLFITGNAWQQSLSHTWVRRFSSKGGEIKRFYTVSALGFLSHQFLCLTPWVFIPNQKPTEMDFPLVIVKNPYL